MSDSDARALAHGYGPPVTVEQVEALRACVALYRRALDRFGSGPVLGVYVLPDTIEAAEAAVAALARAVGGTP